MNTDPQANSAAAFKKADTNPLGLRAYQPKQPPWRPWAAAAAALIATAGLLIILKSVFNKNSPADQLSAQLRVSEIVALETVARQEQKRLLEAFNELAKQGNINTSGWDFTKPTQEQLLTLRRQTPPAAALLAAYLSKLDELALLKQQIRDLEAKLGTARLVRPGDTHFKMAYDFLISQTGRSDEEIRRILQKTRLQEPLLPGFKVWNFWLDDGFCTFVTQGDAPLTIAEASLQALEKHRQEKENALASLNAMYLIIGRFRDLQERQILLGGFLKSTRIGDVPASAFKQTMDLRSQREIRINAADLKLKKIARITVFPSEFRSGIDYDLRLSPQSSRAFLTICKADVFRGRRVVIAVE